MKISAFLALVMLTSHGANAFSPPRPQVHNHYQHKTALQLDILGTEVDVAVLAAAGLAVVGGIGVVVLQGQLKNADSEGMESTAAPVVAPAPEPVVVTPPPAPPVLDLSIPYDAPAKKAYVEAGSPGDYGEFKAKFEADAVADATAKKKARDAAKAA